MWYNKYIVRDSFVKARQRQSYLMVIGLSDQHELSSITINGGGDMNGS